MSLLLLFGTSRPVQAAVLVVGDAPVYTVARADTPVYTVTLADA